MNTKRQALGGFRRIRDQELYVRTATIIKAIENNSYFPDPDPGLPELLQQFNVFEKALGKAKATNGLLDIALKNETRLKLELLLKNLAFYVNRKANGSPEILLSSGFVISEGARKRSIPDSVQDVLLLDGKQSGQMRVSFVRQPSTLFYEYCYSSEPDKQGGYHWTQPITTTKARNNIIEQLQPFQRYYVRVRAVNSSGKSEWSEPVSYVIR